MASLRGLTLVFLGAFGAAVAGAGYATYSASHRAVVTLVDRRIEEVSRALLDETRPGDAAAILERVRLFAGRRETGDIGFELEDARGRWLGGNVHLARVIPSGFSTLYRRDRIVGLTAGRALSRDAGGGLRLITMIETEPVDGYNTLRLRNYVLGFGLIALVVLAGTAGFSLLIRRRIAEVRRTAEAIADGDLGSRVPVDPAGGAFAEQAVSFNRMLDRIALLVEGIRNVGGDIAHDLRTPLARLRSRLTRLVEAAPDAALAQELEAALAQCDEMLGMFAAILRIAEVEGGDRRAGFRPVDLAELAVQIGETMADAAEARGGRLVVAADAPAIVTGDRQLLSQALLNLVENALAHGPAGTMVRIAVAQRGDTVLLSVADNGPGIAPADRAAALRRFGRLDASRNTPGHGLGLPLVEAVARLHRGTLALGEAAPGLVVTLTLPRGPTG
ncbi:hypothetical protein GCM10011380_14660 [Sphingomonas metalli]|uniref:histidine kinase n=1 Tax=Sphingomonas metalli TaxID=1779358 RepID=A0A916T3B8_9SPHN|nr:HAMP domain-containing sensor histidine kinase [Sphingomonas metalli]GGB26235.1 hypothetical protein GCM10011380_14660 [Sphingomonas metalli]